MRKTILALLAASCILSACQGRSAEPDPQSSETIAEIEESAGIIENVEIERRPAFNWKEENWNTQFTEGSDYTIYPENIVRALDCELPGRHANDYGINGNMAYSLNFYYQKIGYSYKQYLMTYNLDTGEESISEFEVPELQGYEGMYLFLVKVEIVNEEEKILFIQPRKEGVNQAFLAVRVSNDNTVKSVVDLQPALAENGVILDGELTINSVYADRQGLIYVYHAWQCIVIDEDGEVFLTVGDYKLETGEGSCFYAGKAPDGSVLTLWREDLFQRSDNGAIFTVDREKGKITLAQGTMPQIPDFTEIALDDKRGYVYYLSDASALYRWDLISGEVQRCVDLADEGVDVKTSRILVALKSSGLPVVLAAEGTIMRIHATSATPVERKIEEVHVVDLISSGPVDENNHNTFVSNSAIRFAKHNGEYKVTVDTADTAGKEGQELYETRNAFRTQKLEEIAAGDMPDILFLNKEDFLMLSDENRLADLTDLYNTQLSDGIFAGSQQDGEIDGKQYAIIPEASAIVMFVDKKVWDKEDTSYEEGAGFVCEISDYPDFSVKMEEVGNKYRVVGVPTETGEGYYWNAWEYVAVSKDALNKQSVKEFLKYVLSDDNMRYSTFSVRKAFLDEPITYLKPIGQDGEGEWKYMTKATRSQFRDFAVKEDGSTYATEYVALMESCTYPTESIEDIMSSIR